MSQIRDEPHPRFDGRAAIHAALSAILAWIAIRLAWPDSTFSTSHVWAVMARMASESVWAMWFWGAATVGVAGLLTNRAVIRLISALTIATAHGTVAGCLMLADISPDSGTYAIIAVLGYYLAFRRAHAGL